MSKSSTLQVCRALKQQGQLSAAVRHLEDALRTSDLANSERVDLLRELADVHTRTGSFDAAVASLNLAFELVGDEEDPGQRLAIREREAWVLFRGGKLADARAIAEEMKIEMAMRLAPDPAVFAGLCNTLGGVAWQQGRLADAAREVAMAAHFYERAGDVVGAANARMNLGVIRYSQGHWVEAVAAFEEAESKFLDAAWTPGRAANLLNLGIVLMSTGDHDGAQQALEESLAVSSESAQTYDERRALIALAQLAIATGGVDTACAYLDRVLAHGNTLPDDDFVQASWLQALVECTRGGAERGFDIASAARQRAQKAQIAESEADCCRAMGVAARQCGRPGEAREFLEQSIALSDRIADPYRRALAQFELALVYEQACGRGDAPIAEAPLRARQAVDEAHGSFQRLGARYDAARAEAARSRIAQLSN